MEEASPSETRGCSWIHLAFLGVTGTLSEGVFLAVAIGWVGESAVGERFG